MFLLTKFLTYATIELQVELVDFTPFSGDSHEGLDRLPQNGLCLVVSPKGVCQMDGRQKGLRRNRGASPKASFGLGTPPDSPRDCSNR